MSFVNVFELGDRDALRSRTDAKSPEKVRVWLEAGRKLARNQPRPHGH